MKERKRIFLKRRAFFSAWFWTIFIFTVYQLFMWCKLEEAIFITLLGGLMALLGYAYAMDEGLRPGPR